MLKSWHFQELIKVICTVCSRMHIHISSQTALWVA